MPNLINTSYSNNMYLNARQREKDEAQYGARNDSVKTEQSLTSAERTEMLRKEREEKMKAEKAQAEASQRGDYRGLIDRVAEQEAKMAKFSAYTQGQQQLLKQVEKTIMPNEEPASYNLKV
ncbi:hypothetical protein AL542_00420 [Grimontia hollisae]|uniref:Uncharacterized protein n=2 Tax=Grimontia hollisae TaxID=673 RepID=D0I9W9_GRIHO|nr:hypothetical protein [Grimontia hollisae]AMG28953.1 hypothetical protein AL542_00420 [Grimontia hollisae]EEY71834.1 hypothetical protein VHA_002256 [Grimontia hollisae CIP 101886]MDF2184758.1 hypothetical protein [Grimontia hollisae]STO77191.1 Uncharacterised protein [Grimontia hollisae]STO98342.1 Uncharacterised protein [Grimontia hollisae]